jgi:uncharacterized protein YbbC (DUF1343 family)
MQRATIAHLFFKEQVIDAFILVTEMTGWTAHPFPF